MDHSDQIRIWFDDEGNYLTVAWGFKKGYYTDTDDNRVLVHIDMEGNVQGFQVEGINSFKNKALTVNYGVNWVGPTGQKESSRPRCVLLVDGSRDEVANRLTRLVDHPHVVVSSGDTWMPSGKPVRLGDSWDKGPAKEAELSNPNKLLPQEVPNGNFRPGGWRRPGGEHTELGYCQHLYYHG